MNPILIVDNYLELEIIEKHYPELVEAPLILLSSNFSPQKLDSFKSRGYTWFDATITIEEGKQLTKDVHDVLWAWFLDENGKDLSKISGCSLGTAFASSLEVMFTNIVKYKAGLEKVLTPTHTVYHSSRTKDLFLDTCSLLQRTIGFKHCPIELNDLKLAVNSKEFNRSFDLPLRTKTLRHLDKNSLRHLIVSKFLRSFQRTKKTSEKRVLIMPAGKLETYFEHLKRFGCSDSFRWILPVESPMELFRRNERLPLFYHLTANGVYDSKNIKPLIDSLKNNINERVTAIEPELLIKGMERHTFNHFSGALNYYQCAFDSMQDLKPDMALFCADGYEFFILAAQAAKQAKIKTAFIPHGLYGWGYSEYKSGRFKVFDYSIACSKKNVSEYIGQGVKTDKILKTSHPYFEKFLKRNDKVNTKYKKALVLSPDFYQVCPSDKISAEYSFYKDVINLLGDLEIELIGIKSRSSFHFKELGIAKNVINIDGNNIPLLSGYTSLPNALKNVDLVIGPCSTAIIEAGLMGKDYYLYQHTPFHEFTPSILPPVYDVVKSSFTMEELRKNILNKEFFEKGFSVDDLINLEGINTRKQLFDKFASDICQLL